MRIEAKIILIVALLVLSVALGRFTIFNMTYKHDRIINSFQYAHAPAVLKSRSHAIYYFIKKTQKTTFLK